MIGDAAHTAVDVRARLAALREHDLPTHGGRTLAYVYDSGRPQVDAVASEALAAFGGTNGLDPSAFPSVAQMERDVLAFAARLFDAPDDAAGTVTSGGTESCLLAVLAARDARADVTRPQIVAPTSVHAAFHKAAHLFGLDLVLVDVDMVTLRADPDAMAAALTDRTVLVVVSAPSYAHGVIDPVGPIAAAAAARGIRCHVDACIGGWVLPFLGDEGERSGRPEWTFAVPGVTSISADLHKYGYAPKGVSLLVHRSMSLRHTHYWATADWPGYGVVNSTLQSTKSGGPLAAAWATCAMLGADGYADLARQARAGTLAIARAISGNDGPGSDARGSDGLGSDARGTAGSRSGIPGLRVLAHPDSTLVAVATDDSCDPYTICDELLVRRWYAQPQLPFRGGPASLHLTISAATAPQVPAFLEALGDAVAAARAAGPVAVDPALARLLAGVDPAALDEATVALLLAAAGLGPDPSGGAGLALPARMAPIHALLAVCPPPLRAALLVAVVERL
ncbi:MAG: aspartate aminotransferase family protein [Actinomycetales bacterium]|nr:aspartate aminotransferase family protein [Actinomycetales bacterium]